MQFIFPLWCVFPLDVQFPQILQAIDETQNETHESSTKSVTQFEKQRWSQYLEIFESYLNKKTKGNPKKAWSKQQDDLLLQLHSNGLTWQDISAKFPETNSKICQRRYERLVQTLIRWPKQLDNQIKHLVEQQKMNWQSIHAHLYASGSEKFPRHTLKEIKERYLLNLKPGIVNEQWSMEEDLKLLAQVKEQGTHWRKLSLLFEGRTELQLKNRYYGILKPLEKKVLRKLNSKMKKSNSCTEDIKGEF